MKVLKLLLVFSNFFVLLNLQSQSRSQAWYTQEMTDSCEAVYQLILNDGYFTKTRYRSDNGGFINTKGGKFLISGDSIRFSYEFDSEDKSKVGSISTYYFKENGGTLSLRSIRKSRTLQPKESSAKTDLTGTYLFSGRKEKNGEITRRNTDQPRKTMKILTGQHFQWIAYNTETGEFSGTGGGRYTAVNGKYQETIEFFSRNNARVGAQLNFEFDKKDNDWHHSGLSSAGEPIYEIWSIRNK
jgi:hypothetical protein